MGILEPIHLQISDGEVHSARFGSPLQGLTKIDNYILSHLYVWYNLESSVNLRDMLFVEAGVPGENPCMHT